MRDVLDISVEPDRIEDTDNGIRVTPLEKLAKLPAVFCKDGWATAGNSSFWTDGASAGLITTEKRALELGLKPKAYIRDIAFASGEPFRYIQYMYMYHEKVILSSC